MGLCTTSPPVLQVGDRYPLLYSTFIFILTFALLHVALVHIASPNLCPYSALAIAIVTIGRST